jgi:hypothetical protein
MHVGMKVRHSEYGVGIVKSVSEHLADIRFDSGLRSLAPDQSPIEPADAQVEISSLSIPLTTLINETVAATVQSLGLEKEDDTPIKELGLRWQKGKVVLHPSDPTLQTKEIPLEVFFHKIVGVRNQLRVLEQKINAHAQLTDGEKVEMQQYISRCYGSLTTFNLLFRNKEDQFSSKGE